MSIRNISTNKKATRRQKAQIFEGNEERLRPSKHIESFKIDNTIQEEPLLSDDDEIVEKSDSKVSNVSGVIDRGGDLNTEHRLIKNPTYTRITHASKQ